MISDVVSIMVAGSWSTFAVSFMQSYWPVWLLRERFIGEGKESITLDIDISFLLNVSIWSEMDLPGDFWPGVSNIIDSSKKLNYRR